MFKKKCKNTKRMLSFVLALAMLVSVMSTAVFAEDASTESTEEVTFIEVSTIEDLYNIRLDLTANYKLMNDIDLTEATAEGGEWDFMGNGWNPIGSGNVYGNGAFSGEFDGNGYKIIGLRIDVSSLPSGVGDNLYFGLFASITGSVHNLIIEGGYVKSNIKTNNQYVGALAGYASNAVISNIRNDMTSVSMTRANNTKGKLYCGGIAGYVDATSVSQCVNNAEISAVANDINSQYIYAGGVAGYNSSSTIAESYNTVGVTTDGCRSSSSYPVYTYAGGICGYSSSGKVECCYNTGTVSAVNGYSNYASGINFSGTVSQCYNVGTVAGTTSDKAVGGSTITDSYYLSGVGSSSTGATALTETQMKMQSMFVGFDFDSTWVIDTTSEYPYPQLLIAEGISLVSKPTKIVYAYGEALDLSGAILEVSIKDYGNKEVPITEDMVSGYNAKKPGEQTLSVVHKGYKVTFNVVVNEIVYEPIYTVADIYNIRNNPSGYYRLMNDVDLTDVTSKGGEWDNNGCGWKPIETFSGVLDGNGYSIIGMRIGGTSDAGLFSSVSGEIRNLNMEEVNISKVTNAGAIATNTIDGAVLKNCHVSGAFSKVSKICGGLVGSSSGTTITKCGNTAKIDAGAYGAGIVGIATNTTISMTYNVGVVTASKGVGYIYNDTYSTKVGTINHYYNYAAGIAQGSATVLDCYSAVEAKVITGVSGTNDIYHPSNYPIAKTATNSYYVSEDGGYYYNSSGNSIFLTETQMKLQSMFVGFDFENTWTLNEFANYPYPQLRENVQDLNESASIVSILSYPVKTDYFTGDKLNFTGAMVKVVYVSGKEEIVDITDDMVSGFDMNTVGEQTVTVTVAGASDTYTINVTERPAVEGVTLVSEPDTKVFAIGTAFDFTGAKAEVLYTGGITEEINITPDMTTGGNINHIGKQTITYTYSGFEISFDVEVLGISLDRIELSSLPEKLTYLEGQSLDLNGLVVTAVMTNGIKNNVKTGYTVSGYSSEPGNHTVTVEYLGKMATFEVTVENRSLVSLTLNSAPAKLEYIAGEKFDPTGMQIVATYDNGENAVVENYTVSGFDDVPGIKTVVITVGDQSVSFTVQVLGKVCNDLKITSLPTKLNYIEYEAFDKTGLKVQATYNDGTIEEITDYEISGFSSKPGIHTVAISYCGFVETFEVNVSARILEDLKIKAPEKVAYYLGEEFDATGLVVTALYNNGQEIDIDDYQMGGFDSISAGTKTITVTYGGISRSFAVVVNERSSIETNGHITVGKAVGRLGETVTLPIIMTNNSGIAGFKNEITFNASNLKFVSAEIAEGFTDGTFIINDEKASEGKLSFVWYDSKDVAKNGVVYNLTFEILETAADGISDVEISFAKNDIGNISGENVSFGAVNGSVDIRSYWLGDLNGDRLCRVADLLSLAQYVAGKQMNLTAKQLLSADVNEDTIIDIHDVIMLQQWILDAGVQETQKASFMSLSGTPDMVISLGEVSGKVGKEVTVPVTVKNNSGLSAFMFEVEYDAEALTFVSAENGEVLDKGTVVTKDNAEKNKVTILWYSANGDVSEDGEIVPLTFKVNDSASGTYDLNVRYIEEDILDENNEAVFCSIVGGKILVGSILSGNVASFFALSEGDPVTLTLSDETGVVDELSTSSGDYEFDSVNAGEYKLTVAKKNHATRTYDITIGDEDAVLDVKINLIGDVNGDGQVKINDYAKVLAVVRGTGTLEGYEAECGDINSDGNIKINDYSKILAHVRGTASLWE